MNAVQLITKAAAWHKTLRCQKYLLVVVIHYGNLSPMLFPSEYYIVSEFALVIYLWQLRLNSIHSGMK